MKTSRILTALFLLGMACTPEVKPQDLLPTPRKMETGRGTFRTDRTLRYAADAGAEAGVAHVRQAIGQGAPATKGKAGTVRLAADPSLADEAYRLRITPDTLFLAASGRTGFLRGAQTLSQLRAGKGALPCCTIDDAPAYRWRGCMLDVSRHFFPLDYLRKQIDVLASFKLNRLHLHLTDGAGWRMEIKRYPRLTQMAAWRPQARWKDWWNGGRRYCSADSAGAYGGFYTQDELRALVAYAEERGVTIVPEIEMPGHSEEVMAAYPELSCTHVPYEQEDFCPGNIGTYDFLENVLREVMDVFPSAYIHVGGDEAAKRSWPDCALCRKKMRELGADNVEALQAHLIARIGRFLQAHGRKLIGWDEIIAGNLGENTTVMVWRDPEHAKTAIAHGYDVVLSPSKYAYIDYYQDAPHTQPEAIGGFIPLEQIYSFRPCEELDATQQSHVLGIQANLWAEYIPTVEQAEYMLYPRILAIAETGWTGEAGRPAYADFRQLALTHTDRLRSEYGIHAFDLRKETGTRPEARRPVAHKARAARVAYNAPFSRYYPAGGDSALVDGRHGGWTHGDGVWQGFSGKAGLDVTIDLGRRRSFRRVEASLVQVPGAWIYFPQRYAVSVSDDGKHFTPLCDRALPEQTSGQTLFEHQAWKGRATGRYIRVQAPQRKPGEWVFCDEITVF